MYSNWPPIATSHSTSCEILFEILFTPMIKVSTYKFNYEFLIYRKGFVFIYNKPLSETEILNKPCIVFESALQFSLILFR